jgi:hypothetical protein
MNCVITVKGDGVGRYGKAKTDQTRTLKDFLVDNVVFYVAVTNHLKTCQVCSVDEVLKEYLRRRVSIAKFSGMTSKSLVTRALILETLAKKKKELLTPGLVNEMIWRGGIPCVIKYHDRLTVRERYDAFDFVGTEAIFEFKNRLVPSDRYLADLACQKGLGKLTMTEVEDLVQIAEVMMG